MCDLWNDIYTWILGENQLLPIVISFLVYVISIIDLISLPREFGSKDERVLAVNRLTHHPFTDIKIYWCRVKKPERELFCKNASFTWQGNKNDGVIYGLFYPDYPPLVRNNPTIQSNTNSTRHYVCIYSFRLLSLGTQTAAAHNNTVEDKAKV
jgi:hypothetical protein